VALLEKFHNSVLAYARTAEDVVTPRTENSKMKSPFQGRLPWAFLVLISLAFSTGLMVAEAAPTTLNSSVTLSGQSDFQDQIGPVLIHCDECLPDILVLNADEATAGLALTVATAVGWEADADIDTSYDTDQIRQGTNAELTNDASAGDGTIRILYELEYIAGIFACGGDFPSCAGENDFGKWETSGDVIEDTIQVSTSGSCSLDETVCSFTDSIPLFSTGDIFLGGTVGLNVELEVAHEFTIGPGGIITDRIVSLVGGAVPNALQSFELPLPSSDEDSFFIPCTVPVDSSANYALTNITADPNVAASLDIDLLIEVEIPGPNFDIADLDLFDTGAFNGLLPMSGSPEPELFLGSVLPDNVAPTIDSVSVDPNPGFEGAPMTFSADASDNCGAPQVHWSFSDGGSEYGAEVEHTFADDGVYSVHLEVFDAQGNVTSQDFLVTVDNVDPNVNAGPDQTSDWGIPVSFHANGADQGSVDNSGLLYVWDFDDPNSPIGAAGQDVSHTFSQPGTYNVEVTVTDKDGASDTDTVVVTITKRTTTITYTGQLQSNPNQQVTLSASLTDEYGLAVPGSLVEFELGAQGADANTNGLGNASTQLKLTQSPGTYDVSASFAGNALYIASGPDAESFTVGNGGGGGGGGVGGGCGTPPCGGPGS
jgi:PKD repeat protein